MKLRFEVEIDMDSIKNEGNTGIFSLFNRDAKIVKSILQVDLHKFNMSLASYGEKSFVYEMMDIQTE